MDGLAYRQHFKIIWPSCGSGRKRLYLIHFRAMCAHFYVTVAYLLSVRT